MLVDSDSMENIVDTVRDLLSRHEGEESEVSRQIILNELYGKVPPDKIYEILDIFLNPTFNPAAYFELRMTDDIGGFVKRYFEPE